MTTETSEITTRDVLQQINRRLELIESDVRAVSEKLDVSVQSCMRSRMRRFRRCTIRMPRPCRRSARRIPRLIEG